MTTQIDLNADMGESFGSWKKGDDAALLDIVTSANIACGFHAGDPLVMMETVQAALDKGVGIGAHPGLDDLRGFGRRRMTGLGGTELKALIGYQIGALQAICAAAGGTVRHVKLHGALGNMTSEDLPMAKTCLEAVRAVDPNLSVIVIASTALEAAAKEVGLAFVREIFADRAYNDDGTLVARGTPGAVLHDPAKIADRVLRMLDEQAIVSINGVRINVVPESICLHGDTPDSVRIAEHLRNRIDGAGIRLACFGR